MLSSTGTRVLLFLSFPDRCIILFGQLSFGEAAARYRFSSLISRVRVCVPAKLNQQGL